MQICSSLHISIEVELLKDLPDDKFPSFDLPLVSRFLPEPRKLVHLISSQEFNKQINKQN